MYYLKISSRSFFSKWRQYISLFLVSMIGVGISLFAMALIDGMLTSLSMKAKIYYAGDFQILGGIDNMDFYNSSDYVSKIESVMPGDAVVAKRRDYDATDCFLCYEGTDARIPSQLQNLFRFMLAIPLPLSCQLSTKTLILPILL